MSKIYVDEIAGIASADTVAIPGHVIQVVTDSDNTETTRTGDSFVSTPLSASITPTSTSSKILVLITSPIQCKTNSGYDSRDETGGSIRIQRAISGGSTTTFAGGQYEIGATSWASSVSNPIRLEQHANIQMVDSPSTTSQITYTMQTRARHSAADSLVSSFAGENSYITLMEIAG